MSHLDSIGFNINSSEEFEALMAKVFEEGVEYKVDEGTYVVYTNESGAQIYAQLDNEGNFLGFMPFYDAQITKEVKLESFVKNEDLSPLDMRYNARSQLETYPFVFDTVNGKTKRLEVKNQELAFVAFPTEIAYFETAEAFVSAMPELSATYFIPVGLMTPEGTPTDNPEPYAMFIGEIKSIEKKTNSYSNQEFYVFELSALEGDVTVVASINSLNNVEPKVGGFINGVYWMGAKV